jgi:molecular chaperone GrpE
MFTSQKSNRSGQKEDSLEHDKERDLNGKETAHNDSHDGHEGAAGTDVAGEPLSGDASTGETAESEVHAVEHEAADGEEHAQPAGDEEIIEPVQKRIGRSSRKKLLDLINRKNAMLQELDKEVKKTRQDLREKEDRLLRLAAEFENYKKRTRREWELLQKQANADLIIEILGGIDNFDRAFENLGGADERLQEGIRLIHAGLMDILKKAGLVEVEALNQKFDPLYHEAVGEIEGEIEEGHVAQVIQKGYLLHGQVIRPARVLVSRQKG